MGRERRDYQRICGIRNPDLIVIATEGHHTERQYFEGLRNKWGLSRLQFKILERDNPTTSSPDHVLAQISRYKSKHGLRQRDELCLVIDRDRWTDANLSDIARKCDQQQYFLALSNPCFEIWLLLHFEDINGKSQKEKEAIRSNHNDYLKKKLRRLLGGFNHSNLQIADFIDHVDTAVKRAEAMDVKRERWPNGLGSRVYEVINKAKQMLASQ